MKDKTFNLKERTYNYALDVIRFLETAPKDYISQTLGKQLLRSATSIGANIIEAQGASSRKDFTNFFHHSLKSANESKFWLGLIGDSGNGTQEKARFLHREASELANILASSLLTMKGKKNRETF